MVQYLIQIPGIPRSKSWSSNLSIYGICVHCVSRRRYLQFRYYSIPGQLCVELSATSLPRCSSVPWTLFGCHLLPSFAPKNSLSPEQESKKTQRGDPEKDPHPGSNRHRNLEVVALKTICYRLALWRCFEGYRWRSRETPRWCL